VLANVLEHLAEKFIRPAVFSDGVRTPSSSSSVSPVFPDFAAEGLRARVRFVNRPRSLEQLGLFVVKYPSAVGERRRRRRLATVISWDGHFFEKALRLFNQSLLR